MKAYKIECMDDYDYYTFDVIADNKEDAKYIAETRMSDAGIYDTIGYHIELIANNCEVDYD